MFLFKISFFVYFAAFLYDARVTSFEMAALARGLSSFASDFYQECAKSKPGNVIVSPLSVSDSLALLSLGAKGKTLEELRRGLYLTTDNNFLGNEFHNYYGLLKKSAGNTTLAIANKVYVRKSLRLRKDFWDLATTKFLAGVESVNFALSHLSAIIINGFVRQKTHHKIQNFIEPWALTSDTNTVLINAIYFKGTWERQFHKDQTQESDFYISETEKISTDFMHIRNRFNFVHSEALGADAIEMKYANSGLSLVIVLPTERNGLPALESKLKNYDWTYIKEEMHEQRIELSVPKFKVESQIELKDVLTAMGMGEMFTGRADFSGLVEGVGDVSVSKIIHKAFIEIDEEGVTATAAAGVLIESRPGAQRDMPFNVNHPFIYFIQDRATNTILFSGRIERPGK